MGLSWEHNTAMPLTIREQLTSYYCGGSQRRHVPTGVCEGHVCAERKDVCTEECLPVDSALPSAHSQHACVWGGGDFWPRASEEGAGGSVTHSLRSFAFQFSLMSFIAPPDPGECAITPGFHQPRARSTYRTWDSVGFRASQKSLRIYPETLQLCNTSAQL